MSIADPEETSCEIQNQEYLRRVILKARDPLSAVSDAYKNPWTKNPSTGIRAFIGHSLTKAHRHFAAAIILCEAQHLSMVVNVHHRQMFETFLQIRYFLSLDQDKKEYIAEKIAAWGCVEFLEKLESTKQLDNVKKGYADMQERLTHFDKNIVDEIYSENKLRPRKNNWFGSTYSELAKNVSKDGEDLRRVYQIISADIHGTWDLILEVANPKPGVLDFRGYPDKSTMYRWAAESLKQVMNLQIQLWNEVAVAVGAPEV